MSQKIKVDQIADLSATAAQLNFTTGVTSNIQTQLDEKLPLSGGALTGAVTTNSTFDGRDVSADGAKLDGVEAGATADQTASEIRALVESATDSNVFTDADHTKLNGIEAGANVTDATNVAAAGALMDSEVTNLAQVKSFDSSDYATAAQGTTADAALPRSGGAMTGAITTNSTFDGRNVSVDGAKLDGIEAGATADQTASEILTAIKTVDGAASGLDADLLDGQQGSYYTNYADTAVANLVDSAPAALDTLNELAAALGDDANFSTTVNNSIATKLPLTGGAMTGAITTNSTFDGRNVSVDGAKLDGIEAGATADQTASEIRALVESATDSNVFTDADHTKLNGIEANADVTDVTNVTAAGALMDSEVTNLAQVKAFDSSDYATAAQGTTADAALPRSGGAMTGAITTNSTFDGRNVSVDGAKLDGIAAGAIANVVEDTTPQLGGDLQSNGHDIVFADNDKAIFGANTDLEIYSDAVSSFVHSKKAGAYLRLKSEGGIVLQAGNSENVMFAAQNGKTALYFDAAEKLETTSTGVAITGTLAATAVTGDGSGLTNLPASGIANLVEDTTPQLGGNLDTNGNDITFGDNDAAVFGTNGDLTINHTGTNSFITDSGTGSLYIQGTSGVFIRSGDGGENLAGFTDDGAATLYHNNAEKLATTSTGVDVTGVITTDGLTTSADINFGDLDKAVFGAGSDLRIYHNGANSYIEDVGTGNLHIKGANLILEDSVGYDFIKMTDNGTGGTVEIKHLGSTKLTTTSTGVSITGTLAATAVTGDGSGLTNLPASSGVTYALATTNPSSPSAGDSYYNTAEEVIKVFDGTDWYETSELSVPVFVDAFAAAGGGGGSKGLPGAYYGGGGAGGTVRQTSSGAKMTPGTTISVSIGGGGAAAAYTTGGTGGTTTISGGSISLSATGGGGDPHSSPAGGSNADYSGAATSGAAAGGAGAGSAGNAGSSFGGPATQDAYLSQYFGGGGADPYSTPGTNGASWKQSAPSGYGGGAGGADANTNAGNGGSGRAIIRVGQQAASTTGSPSVTQSGSYYIYSFTGAGSVTI